MTDTILAALLVLLAGNVLALAALLSAVRSALRLARPSAPARWRWGHGSSTPAEAGAVVTVRPGTYLLSVLHAPLFLAVEGAPGLTPLAAGAELVITVDAGQTWLVSPPAGQKRGGTLTITPSGSEVIA